METKPSYMVTVRATDPAGIPQAQTVDMLNSDTVTVVITVTGVNEPPTVTGGAEVTFDEVGGDITATLGNPYTAVDPETNTPITWSVSGADGGKFNIPGGELTFKAKPNYENPTDANGDNDYEVTVVATDSLGNRGTKAVRSKSPTWMRTVW